MRKLIFLLVFVSNMLLTSCSSMLHNLPGVYTLDIQQGNIINQEMIDQLRPKMTKRQVIYIMGSSMLVDVFHQKRWDYLYSEQLGGEARRQKRLTLFFDGDELIGVQGDFRPTTLPVIRESLETTVVIPERDLEKTLWEKITGLFTDEIETKRTEQLTEEEIIDNNTAVDPALETSDTTEISQDIENGEVSLNPLKEDNPQKLEEIQNKQKALSMPTDK